MRRKATSVALLVVSRGLIVFVTICLLGPGQSLITTTGVAQTVMQQLVLQQVDAEWIASEARLRGDARRGAIVFYTSAAGCTKCHLFGEGITPLGPDLARLGDKITDVHLVESLLQPSKSIRERVPHHSAIDEQWRSKKWDVGS